MDLQELHEFNDQLDRFLRYFLRLSKTETAQREEWWVRCRRFEAEDMTRAVGDMIEEFPPTRMPAMGKVLESMRRYARGRDSARDSTVLDLENIPARPGYQKAMRSLMDRLRGVSRPLVTEADAPEHLRSSLQVQPEITAEDAPEELQSALADQTISDEERTEAELRMDGWVLGERDARRVARAEAAEEMELWLRDERHDRFVQAQGILIEKYQVDTRYWPFFPLSDLDAHLTRKLIWTRAADYLGSKGKTEPISEMDLNEMNPSWVDEVFRPTVESWSAA